MFIEEANLAFRTYGLMGTLIGCVSMLLFIVGDHELGIQGRWAEYFVTRLHDSLVMT